MTGVYCIRGAVAAICLTVSVSAMAEDRQPVTAQIGYADLNLATPAGKAALKRRIERAAAATCVSGVGGLAGDLDSLRCVREMEHDGYTRLATLSTPSATQLAAVAPSKLPVK